MDASGRTAPDPTGGNRSQLAAFLDYQRETILWKVEGISEEDARRTVVPSGTSLAGVVKHLAFVERFWFQKVFAGRNVEFPWSEDEPDADWDVGAWESMAGLTEFYRREIEISHAITRSAGSLKERSADSEVEVNLRWVLLHMIEETARHAGHVDILRELLDGTTGE